MPLNTMWLLGSLSREYPSCGLIAVLLTQLSTFVEFCFKLQGEVCAYKQANNEEGIRS